jgi:hypothetical protein
MTEDEHKELHFIVMVHFRGGTVSCLKPNDADKSLEKQGYIKITKIIRIGLFVYRLQVTPDGLKALASDSGRRV